MKRKSVIYLLIGLTLFVILYLWKAPATFDSRPEVLRYKLGNFTFTSVTSQIYRNNNWGTGEVLNKVEKVASDPDDQCNKITGEIYQLSAKKVIEGDPTTPFKWMGSLYLIEWNEDKLTYLNEEVEQQVKKRLKELRDLKKYENKEVLVDGTPALTLERGISGCAWGYSYPILIKKVDSLFYGAAYYAEEFSGNGWISSPVRYLILNKGKDWLILDEMGTNDKLLKQDWNSNCEKIKDKTQWIGCYKKQWDEKYRNVSEDELWLKRMMRMVRHKDSFRIWGLGWG
jgi:hypothetical protein